jgi:hypothetical protein
MSIVSTLSRAHSGSAVRPTLPLCSTAITRVDPGQAATRFDFIGMLPSEEEWAAQFASDPEPVVIPYNGPLECGDDDEDLD